MESFSHGFAEVAGVEVIQEHGKHAEESGGMQPWRTCSPESFRNEGKPWKMRQHCDFFQWADQELPEEETEKVMMIRKLPEEDEEKVKLRKKVLWMKSKVKRCEWRLKIDSCIHWDYWVAMAIQHLVAAIIGKR
ncbi:hypothetical protein PIB30_050775 [Stylosanthes scabra]|uniref:Uncharacterized protein n=1 Tax=Stylosanthes scabra TaxID=79078 RepID=A0ABU6WIR9_9FABA|nr:hypothetical protein [Stylosanthes scabra]